MARLDAVTLQICEGVTAVMGHSGAGKTSLLDLLVGFGQPDSGTISWNRPSKSFSLPLYWVPQDAGLWPHLTVREHLEAVRPPDVEQSRTAAVLDSLGILEKAATCPDRLSMGERSRLAVARALMAGAAVLVMDEPFMHVDQAGAVGYWEAIRRHVSDTGTSLVFATHSPKNALREADSVICLKEGRLLYEGDLTQLYWYPATREQAEGLGEVNWLSEEEVGLWLGDGYDGRRCYRPEHVCVAGSETGPLVVRSCRPLGAIAEAELLHEETGKVRRFYHQSRAGGLCPGDRVVLKAILLLLVALVLGCGESAVPSFRVQDEHYWQMPPYGSKVPAPRAVAIGAHDEVLVLDTAARVLIFDENGKLKKHWRMPDVEAGNPEGVCVLQDGRIAVSDTHYHRVTIFDRNGRVVGQFGGYGTGPGEFIYPAAVVQDDRGNLYVCEYGSNDRIQKFTADGEFILSFGSFGTGPGQFQRPAGMVWYDGKLYVADAINNRIQLFSDGGQFLGVLGAPGKEPLLHFPYGIDMGRDGALYAIEYGAGRIAKLALDGQLLGRYGTTGRGEGQFNTPWGLAIDSRIRVRVADTGNRRIVELKL